MEIYVTGNVFLIEHCLYVKCAFEAKQGNMSSSKQCVTDQRGKGLHSKLGCNNLQVLGTSTGSELTQFSGRHAFEAEGAKMFDGNCKFKRVTEKKLYAIVLLCGCQNRCRLFGKNMYMVVLLFTS
jgi:hypothetical protein